MYSRNAAENFRFGDRNRMNDKYETQMVGGKLPQGISMTGFSERYDKQKTMIRTIKIRTTSHKSDCDGILGHVVKPDNYRNYVFIQQSTITFLFRFLEIRM